MKLPHFPPIVGLFRPKWPIFSENSTFFSTFTGIIPDWMTAHFLYFGKTRTYKWEKGIWKKNCEKKNWDRCYLWGPQAIKSLFLMRGATLFSLAIRPFKNPNIPNFTNETGKHLKKGPWVQIAQKRHCEKLAKFKQRSPVETVFTYRISLYFAKRR